jgi:hypothetical protein
LDQSVFVFGWDCPVHQTLSNAQHRPAVAKGGEGPNMDATLSFLISAGIMAFGVWIVVGTVIAGSPMAWKFTGLVPMVVGSISLYQVVSGVKSA